MVNYADETYYSNSYLCGKTAVITAAFPYYARSATLKIKQYTGTNVDEDNISNEVKNCCCEVAEQLYRAEQTLINSGGVSSESVEGWSKSYESSDARNQVLDQSVHDIVYKWLSGTGLLYRGVR